MHFFLDWLDCGRDMREWAPPDVVTSQPRRISGKRLTFSLE